MEPDFTGWATKANVKCKDGRTIMPDAFAHQDNLKIPLVYAHGHDSADNVMGHVYLRNKPEGVYCEGFFNQSPQGINGKNLVQHGDIDSLSIWANELVEKSKQVFHGMMREVSLVLSGANPEAKIDFVQIQHSDGEVTTAADEAIITMGAEASLKHEAESTSSDSGSGKEETAQDVYDSMSPEQKELVAAMVGAALTGDSASHSGTTENDTTKQEENDVTLKHNVFDTEKNGGEGSTKTLSHSDMDSIVSDYKAGSLKESMLAHAGEYGVQDLEVLFPEAKVVDNVPELITRQQAWVSVFMSGTKKLPYTRIKTIWASITHEEARAKGYIKGNFKKETFFRLASRKTEPQTVYVKQKLDRDDIIDVTTMDLVSFLWGEMRVMFNEELARAGLLGDGRSYDDVDKINPENIRPVVTESEFFNHRIGIPSNALPDDIVELVSRSRKYYRGTGNPTLFLTEDALGELLWAKDGQMRRLYNSVEELASAMRVAAVVPVELLEEYVLPEDDDDEGKGVWGVYLNLSDYSWGTDSGGELAKFDDFDIDYNQYKYMMESRLSGALTKFKCAVTFIKGGESMTERYPEVYPGGETLAPQEYRGTQRQVTGRGGVTPEGKTVLVSDQPASPTKNGKNIVFAAGNGYHWTIDNNGSYQPGSTVTVPDGSHAVKAVANDGYELPKGVQSNWTITTP